MRNVVVESSLAALAGLRDGHAVMVGGFGGAGMPRALIRVAAEMGLRDLTLISNNAGTAGDDLSLWFRQRMVRKIICSYPRGARDFGAQYRAGEVELELVPQGTLVERIRAGGAGLGGFLSPVGIGTSFAEGKQVVEVKGRPFLLELPLRADFALVRGWLADGMGNLTYNKAARNHCAIMATAADTVVAEVERIVDPGALDPEAIVTPCIFVDRVFSERLA